MPVLIKDNIEARRAARHGRLPGPARLAAGRDAPLVRRLRGAGLVVLGATNLSEWANFRSTASTSGWSAVGGQTRNPYDPDRNTSGSSSGSAAAIAAGPGPAGGGHRDRRLDRLAGRRVRRGRVQADRRPGPRRRHRPDQLPAGHRRSDGPRPSPTRRRCSRCWPAVPRQPSPRSRWPAGRVALWRPDGMTDRGARGASTRWPSGCGSRLRADRARCRPSSGRSRTPSSTPCWPSSRWSCRPICERGRESTRAIGRSCWPSTGPMSWSCRSSPMRSSAAACRAGAAASVGGLPDGTEAAATRPAAQALAGVLDGAEFALAPTNSPAWPIELRRRGRARAADLVAVRGDRLAVGQPAGRQRARPADRASACSAGTARTSGCWPSPPTCRRCCPAGLPAGLSWSCRAQAGFAEHPHSASSTHVRTGATADSGWPGTPQPTCGRTSRCHRAASARVAVLGAPQCVARPH